MRLSIPGLPGVYYDTDSGTTAIGVATTAIGRKVPKPKGYAIQLLPYLWSFEVDLREVPNDHPVQYLHPEGAQSLGELSPERSASRAGTELESVLRFVWSVNQELESTTNQLIGRSPSRDGVVIEIQDGRVSVDGDELETDEFDIDDSAAGAGGAGGIDEVTTVDINDGAPAGPDDDVPGGSDSEGTDTETDANAFGATEEPPADDEFDGTDGFEDDDETFGSDDASDDIDPDEP
ncbi:hypothetical protein [Natronolimnohabitans innermongolicus]|uniref:Uncharacterized protein n=1 Tax=Natronolimnohabitans innermongolicus JCM 12255 TaxID=1227499 RepID=L9X038_9EURY|nr:hypothetical protein [Natronolimnohabitans innermongolicus]ELY53978.1 hypothetical protein C493_13048 [Natronolimnohabitans innermongolicus JCM 12255]